jgi:hypothetical protein
MAATVKLTLSIEPHEKRRNSFSQKIETSITVTQKIQELLDGP